MLEDSVENFILRWRPYAAEVEVFASTEGSPMIEVKANDVILQLFERTNPYLSTVGKAHIIIHPVAEQIRPADEPGKAIQAVALSRIQAKGLILMRDDPMLIVDAGVPLVVGVPSAMDDLISEGEWIVLESQAPVHGFVLEQRSRSSYSSQAMV